MGEVPDSLPVTEETRDRLRAQANQLPEPTVIRLCDLLAVAVDDMRQGGDPRLPLELALIKVTRPGADLERESLAFRIEQLESRPSVPGAVESQGPADEPSPPPAGAPPVELEQLQDAWQRAVIPAVEQRSIPTASVLREAHPSELDGDTLKLEFPATAALRAASSSRPRFSPRFGTRMRTRRPARSESHPSSRSPSAAGNGTGTWISGGATRSV